MEDAVSIHGYPRLTKDLDISIQVNEDNAARIIEVINEFGLSSLRLSKDDFLKANFVTQLGYEPVGIDILNDLDVVSFEEAWNNRKVVTIFDIPINFIGLEELIIIKERAGENRILQMLIN